MSNLSDIGFPTPDEQAVNEMIMHVLEVASPVECSHGFYLKYSDPSGAEIYLQGNFDQELVGFNPHFAGKSRRRVGLARAIERDSSPLDGGFYAWADPDETKIVESGEYPFVFDVPDFRLVNEPTLPALREIQLTAFASNDFKHFDSDEEFCASQDSDLKFAVRSFVPSGLFNVAEGEKADDTIPPRPVGILSGVIKEAELRTNELSGESFYWFLVDTLGGEVDVVADRKLLKDEPRIGGIVNGHFWLTGRLLETIS